MIEYLTLCNAKNCKLASSCERKTGENVNPDTPVKDFSDEAGWVASDCAGYAPTRNKQSRARMNFYR
jgi:hypothetical protein